MTEKQKFNIKNFIFLIILLVVTYGIYKFVNYSLSQGITEMVDYSNPLGLEIQNFTVYPDGLSFVLVNPTDKTHEFYINFISIAARNFGVSCVIRSEFAGKVIYMPPKDTKYYSIVFRDYPDCSKFEIYNREERVEYMLTLYYEEMPSPNKTHTRNGRVTVQTVYIKK